MIIKIKKINPEAKLPEYSRVGDAGMDIFSCEDYELMPGEKHNFNSGFSAEIPEGYFGKLYDKSGFANKHQIINLGGVIDSNYRGQWNITLKNIGDKSYKIKKGEKIAQVIFHQIPQIEIEEVDQLNDTGRGTGWAGSSGRF